MKPTASIIFKVLLFVTLLLNIFDVVLHIGIGQPETLRITGNIIVIVGSIIGLLVRRPRLPLTAGLAAYLTFNGIFISLHGIGSAGIVFITLSTLLVILSVVLYKTK